MLMFAHYMCKTITMTTLVICESPNKIKSLQKYLGSGYRVAATVGHFRDLPEKALGIDTRSWDVSYVLLPGKEGVAVKLREAARGCSDVLLGTDKDREGEAIAWHVAQELRLRSPRRLRFDAITAKSIKAALAAVGPLDQHLVDAQQARRVLDRLVGYQVSPLLAVFGPGHSAGRVQSAALHLVVEREKARKAFKVEVSYGVVAEYAGGFTATLVQLDEKKKWVPLRVTDRREAERLTVALSKGPNPHRVEAVEVREVLRKPKAPFTTSTLLQAASAQLNLRPAETMATAQQLFELGVITYHRTDSVTLSDDAIAMAREFIAREHPPALPSEPVRYRNAAAAQEAHEAIRPTAMQLESDVKLSAEQESLYSLINLRFIASQCQPAVLEETVALLVSNEHSLIARGTAVKFDSFLKFVAEDEETVEARAEAAAVGDASSARLPSMKHGDEHRFVRLTPKEQKTSAPPRFTQATLVKALEASGIGRPATYPTIFVVLFERRYLVEEGKALVPTDRGVLVDGALAVAMPDVVATDYTARLEAELDEIAHGKRRWKDALTSWHQDFSRRLVAAPAALQRFAQENKSLIDAIGEAPKALGKPCPQCGKELQLRTGSKGPFISCSGFPSCEYRADPSSRPSTHRCPKCAGAMTEQDGKFGRFASCNNRACEGRLDATVVTAEKCPRCNKPLRDKGAFLGCSDYPRCNFTVDAKALERAKKSGAKCSKCSSLMVERKGAKGPFLSCLRYPDCKETAQVRKSASTAKKAVARG